MSFLLLLPACVIESEVTPIDEAPEAVTSELESVGVGEDPVEGVGESPVVDPIWINEVCPANRYALVEGEESPDWIELRNPHDHPIDVSGFGLSDDPDQPFLFTLPELIIDPGQIVLVRASGREESEAGQLHAPFKLKAEGETLVLTGADGREHDRLETGRLYFDMSAGRDPDTGQLLFYMSPTPWEENLTEGRPGFAEAPVIGPDGGFVESPQTIVINAASEAATVYYSTDGERPTTDGPIYAEPFDLPGGPAAVVRAFAVVNGLWPSRITTRTFLVDRPVDLPVWSVVSADAELWDEDLGIFSPRNLYDNIEIDTHLELYEADGSLVLATDAGLKAHGGATRTHAQKPVRLLFRSGYGEAPFQYAMFPDRAVAEFDRLILRTGGHDSGYTEIRDALTHEMMKGLDLDTQGWRPTVLFLNGIYWGIYNTREKQDRFYFEDHHGVDPENLDVLEYDGWTVNEGTHDDYQYLFDFVVNDDMSDPANEESLAEWVDLQEYALYTIAEIHGGNYDWPGNNIQFWRPREYGGKWRWTLYDTEAGWNNWVGPDYNMIHHATVVGRTWWPYPNWSTSLFRNALDSPMFRDLWINTYADLLNTRFQPRELIPLWDGMVDQIRNEIPANQARWGYTESQWNAHVTAVRDYINDRPGYVEQHILFEFGLQGTWDLSLDVDPPGAGHVELQVITVDEPFVGTYFLDVPVPVTAVAAEGYEFVGWSDEALGTSKSLKLTPGGDKALVALFEVVP